MATSYANPGGTGDRTASITVTTTGGSTGGGGGPATLVNGVLSEFAFYASSITALTFQFLTPKVIDEAKFYQSGATSHGSWKWQGSPNGSTWTDIGGAFTLDGAAAPQVITALAGNTTAYLYYQLVPAGGTWSISPWLWEFEFKIDEGASSTLARVTQDVVEVLSLPVLPVGRVSQYTVELLTSTTLLEPFPVTRVNVATYAPFSSSGGNTIAAPAQATTTGNALVVVVGGYANAGQVVASLTDTAGNTYTKVDHAFEAGDIYREELWYAKNITGHASNIVTATWSGFLSFTYFGITVIQYAGLDPVAPLDGTAKGTTASGTTVTTGTLTTTRTDSVHVMVPRWGNGGTVTWPAGFGGNLTGDATVTASERFVTPPYVGPYTLTYPSPAANFALVASFTASPATAPTAVERAQAFVFFPG